MTRSIAAVFVLAIALVACSPGSKTDDPDSPAAVPIESTGSDELRDLIMPGDNSAFGCVVDLGVGPGEFYDKATDQLLFPEQAYFFEARYGDGVTVEIRIHPDIASSSDDARMQSLRIAEPIGLLPIELRAGIERVGMLRGDTTSQADGGGEGIMLYADNVATRERAGRFEETLFHESVHTSLDDQYATSPQWVEAQQNDGEFLTEYAASQPDAEDLAETALYAWALLHHPDRIADADAAAWSVAVPSRIALVGDILSAPESQPTGPVNGC